MNLVQARIHPAHGSRAGRGWKFPPATAISVLLDLRIMPLGQFRPASAGCFSPLIILNMSIIGALGGCHADPASLRSVRRACASASTHCGRLRRGPSLRRAAGAFARMECPGRARDCSALRPGKEGDSAGRMAVLRALRQGDQRAQAGAQRGHPGAQLPDAGDLQLRRRFRRRLAPACARGDQGRCRHHRPVRRAFHGRDRRRSSIRTRPC